MRNRPEPAQTVALCETQPCTVEGVRRWLEEGSLSVAWVAPSLKVGFQLLGQAPPGILLLDKGFGVAEVLEFLRNSSTIAPDTQKAVWGSSLTESEALRLVQSGARGILSKNASRETVLSCLETLASGLPWMGDCMFAGEAPERSGRMQLTSREAQVLALVERGLKNREIGRELGIQPGTVKIHLRHIFEKTGVHGRYSLALNGLQSRGIAAAAQGRLGRRDFAASGPPTAA